MSLTWREFWNKKNSIYVSERHRKVHFDAVARDVLAMLPEKRPLTLLDWGCGEALGAPFLSRAGLRVILHDPVEFPHAQIRTRFAGDPNIRVLGVEEIATLTEHSVDAILINSVLQYITKDEFRSLLPRFHVLLAPDAVLLLGDIVLPGSRMTDDVLALLKAGLQNGFFFDVVSGLVATLFSDYRAVRRSSGFTVYREDEIIAVLKEAGFNSIRRRPNIGLAPHRMLIEARPVWKA